jgi:hypothetical protein
VKLRFLFSCFKSCMLNDVMNEAFDLTRKIALYPPSLWKINHQAISAAEEKNILSCITPMSEF